MIIPEMSAYLLEERAYRLIEDNLITVFNATVSCSEVLREGWGKKQRYMIKPCNIMSLAIVVYSSDELDSQLTL